MKKITKLTALLMVLTSAWMTAQTARLQVIHNSADLAAAQVDVYVNDALLLDNFAFRTATPFIDVPAGVPLSIDVAPASSTSSADGIYNLTETLTAGETYIAIANGIVSPSGYTPNQPFNIYVYPTAREAADVSTNTDVLVFHGATDAPTVDVQAVGAGTIVDNLDYTEFAGYLELPTADYTLSVATADGSTVVASYLAPLDTLNLDGAALTVLASGFLNPTQNSDGPAFGLWVALPAGGPLVQLPSATITSRLQVIHNSADLAAAQVDVYVNDVLLLDNFAFRTATPFIDVPAGVPLSIDVAPASSTSSADGIYNLTETLTAGETYIAIANGIVSPSGYTPNQPFNIYVYPTAREAADVSTNTDVLVFHGATDAPTVDVQAVGAGTIVDNLDYTEFAGYLELPTADYTLSVATADGSTVVASYLAPLDTLNLDGAALTVLASGFLDPDQNNHGPEFGLWVALPAGGPLVQLPSATITSRLQVIHNSADLAAAQVDVYVNDVLLLDNFAFRTATPFIDVPAGVPLSIDVAPASSTSSADGIYNLTETLTAGETYIAIANGIVSPSGYTPNQPFNIYVYPTAREAADVSTNTDVLVFHGATDAPTVDVQAVGAGTIVDNLDYTEFAGYLELPTADYTLSVATADGSTVVASYLAPLDTLNLDGAALTVLASGFLDPDQNNHGPEFGLWVALPAGGPLVQLPSATITSRLQVIHNSADLAAAQVDVYVNDVLLLDNFAFRTATPFIDVPAGVPLSIDVAPASSTSSADGIYNLTETLTAGETYIAIANGIVSPSGYTPNQPFNIYVYPTAREAADVSTNTDVLVFHGATDAPTVDVQAVGAGTIVDNLDYTDFAGYLELPTADYTLSVATADGSTVVASYLAPLDTLNLDGAALTVLASGFLDPTQNSDGPAFGLWVALPAGGPLVQLPLTTLSVGENDQAKPAIYPNPARSTVSLAIPFGYSQITNTVYDQNGRKVLSAAGDTINIEGLASGIYLLESNIDEVVFRNKIVVAN